MRRVKIFVADKYNAEDEITEWQDEEPEVKIISVNGVWDHSYNNIITYVLYEDDPDSNF